MLLRDGRLVKGVRYADAKDAGRPETTARVYNAQGADELIVMDIDASKERRRPDFETFGKVAQECFMPLIFGGGLTSIADVHRCMEVGADKICLTATAQDRPDLITEVAEVFGSQAIVLGVDMFPDNRGWKLYDHRSGQVVEGRDPFEWIHEGIERGAGEIRLMNAAREGMREGLDVDLVRAVADVASVPIIIEGGAGTLEHLSEGLSAGADGVALGTMLVFSDNNLVKVKRYLSSTGQDMRL